MGPPSPSTATGSAHARRRSSGQPSTGSTARRGRRSTAGRGPATGSGPQNLSSSDLAQQRRWRRIWDRSCCSSTRARPRRPVLLVTGSGLHLTGSSSSSPDLVVAAACASCGHQQRAGGESWHAPLSPDGRLRHRAPPPQEPANWRPRPRRRTRGERVRERGSRTRPRFREPRRH